MSRKDLIQKMSATPETSILTVMNIIEQGGMRTALVVKENKLKGIVMDGDIRRALLKGLPLTTPISEIMTKNPLVLRNVNCNREDVLKLMLEFQVFIIPILNDFKEIIDVTSLPQLLSQFIDLEPRLELLKKGVEEDIKRPKVLVIGGAGYIGSVVTMHLAQMGYFVRILDLFYYGMDSYNELVRFKNIEIIKGDMKSAKILQDVMQNIDIVIHLGAIVGDPACNSNPDLALQSNFLTTQHIVDTCKKLHIKYLIFASTCSVYGASPTEDSLTEDAPLNPVSIYAQTKIDSEKYILSNKDHNFSPLILRFATAFGHSPRMRFDLAINVMTANCFFNKQLNIFSGNQWRPFVNIGDIALIIGKILNIGIQNLSYSVYNCGFNELNFLIKDLVPIFQSLFTNLKVKVDAGQEDKRTYRVSFDRLKKEINPQIQYPIKRGVEEIIAFLKEKSVTRQNFNFLDEKYSNFKKIDFGSLQSLYFEE